MTNTHITVQHTGFTPKSWFDMEHTRGNPIRFKTIQEAKEFIEKHKSCDTQYRIVQHYIVSNYNTDDNLINSVHTRDYIYV